MSDKRLKVLWVCHFSDVKTREKLHFDPLYFKRFLRIIKKREALEYRDQAVWVSNAIKEFEKFDDIDLTIVFPHFAIKGALQEFSLNGIHYKCFRSEDDNLQSFIKYHLFHKQERTFLHNRKIVSDIIDKVSPDVIHVIGAENPYYSITALEVPRNIPVVVSLQTLLSDPDFFNNYNISVDYYKYRSEIEASVIQRSNYIATPVKQYRELIERYVKKDAVYLQMYLALGQDPDLTPVEKEYDFVYYAKNIDKAGDYAIEAFALVCQQYPDAKLNLSGLCSPQFRSQIEDRLKEIGIYNNVVFTGPQATHDDVLYQIKKSRFALLPLKIDLISCTVREAMACGLPVVTTITPATPELNMKRESVLLSEKGDFSAMASNMLRLLGDEDFSNKIRNNALITLEEQYSNRAFMEVWRAGYYEIRDNFHYNKPFSVQLLGKQ